MKIVAIGGGEIGRFDARVNTTPIDREIVRLSNKATPRFLFIPTASSENEEYCAAIFKQFSKKLGCRVDILLLKNTDPDPEFIEERFARADIIYVGEGNTLRMMKRWRRYGVDVALRKAAQRGAVLCGSSAGSIAWFTHGNSDSLKSEENPHKLIRVKGLGFIKALICPHYDKESARKESLKEMMKTTSGVAIALEDCCAIVIVDDEYRVLSSVKGRKAYKVYWKKDTFHKEVIEPSSTFMPLIPLLKKP